MLYGGLPYDVWQAFGWYGYPEDIMHTYIYTFHRSPRLSPDNRMWNMSKTYKSIQDIENYYSKNLHSHLSQ